MEKVESKELDYLKKLWSNTTITHWIENSNVKFHVFLLKIETEQQLDDVWEQFTDTIAGYFQSELENEYESWNVYVVFLAPDEIDKGLKFRIENDKYSSRKIVLDAIPTSIDEEEIVSKIEERLFRLNIHSKGQQNHREHDLTEIIDNKLYSLISQVDLEGRERTIIDNRKKILDELLSEYSNEIQKS